LGDTGDFAGEGIEPIHHFVDHGTNAMEFSFERFAVYIEGDLLREVACSNGDKDAGHFCGGFGQVVDQLVDGTEGGAPGSFGGPQVGSCVELTFFANHLADASDFVGLFLVETHQLVKGDGNFAQSVVFW